MNTFLSTIIIIFFSFFSFTQDQISWSGKYDAVKSKAILTATLSDGWHVYSQKTDENAGPVATKFNWEKNDYVIFENSMFEPKPIVAYDPNFEAEVKYFEKQVDFEQKLKITGNTTIACRVTYMLCNDEMCLPPVDREIKIMITQ